MTRAIDEDAATHISQYESPFEKIQVESTTIHHCHRLHETFSRHFALISRFLDRHPQVVTLILVVCLLLLLHVLLSTCNLNRAHDDTPEDKKSPSAQVDTSEMRKEG